MYSKIINIIISGISGSVGAVLTIYFQRRFMLYDLKRDALIQFVENRYDIKGELFTKSINRIHAVYAQDQKVIEAIEEFHTLISSQTSSTDKTNQKLYQIHLVMCNSIKIKPMSETMFLMPFNIKEDNK